MKLALCAGEVSGDIYGGLLARKLRELAPDIDLIGVGGQRMAAAGVRPVARLPLGAMGITGVVRRLPAYAAALRHTASALLTERPDSVVLIDNPGFNLRLARIVGTRLPCVYYIPPKVWAHGYARIRMLRRYVQEVIAIFPFETALYQEAAVPCRWFGHPIVDLVDRSADTSAFLRSCHLRNDAPLIGLLPGSRAEEVDALMPSFIAVLREVRKAFPAVQAVVSSAGGNLGRIASRHLRRAGEHLPVWEGSVHTLVRASSLALAASGTVNLEVALLRTPLIVFYRTSSLNYLAARLVVKSRWISPVNILLGEEVVPEHIQRIPAARAAEQAVELLRGGPAAQRQSDAAERLACLLGEANVTDRIAGWIFRQTAARAHARGARC